MQRLAISLIGALLLNFICVGSVPAGTKPEDQIKSAERVKPQIFKLGTGPEARVEVKLQDKTRLKGFIRDADETQFVVVDSASGVATAVQYLQVRKVKGNNLSTGVKVAIGIGIAFLALVVFCKWHGCEE